MVPACDAGPHPEARLSAPDSPSSLAREAALEIPLEMREALRFVHRIGGASLLDKIVRLFRSSSEERLVLLRSAVARDDRVALTRLAHALKGSAAQVGAEPLRSASATLEQHAASLPIDRVRVEVEALAALTALAREQLDVERQALDVQAGAS